MDIGTAFLLGVLVGQWALLFAIARTMNRLLVFLTEQETEADSFTNKEIISYPSRDQYRDSG
ncbi:MAG: hypothetical protein JSV61_06810 [Anaerolineales bacterium]|nr:MAG: hypothetical protein JSV61_06810 [Anaerolineales bacterium]